MIDPEPLPDPQTLANRRNAARSTGPRTEAGKERSRRNAITHGLRAETVVDPSELSAVARTVEAFSTDVRPDCAIETDLVRCAAVAAVRKQRCERAEQALMIPRANKVVRAWEKKRQKSIRRRAQHLRSNPDEVIDDLEASAFGCDWLSRQWDDLDDFLAMGLRWDAENTNHAIRLTGRDPDAAGDPFADSIRSLAAALDGPEAESSRQTLRAFVANEQERLRQLRATAWEAIDGPEREAVRQAALIDTSDEGRKRQRYERDAELSKHRNMNLILRMRRDEARLEYRAQQIAQENVIPRKPIGGGWWVEPNATFAPPGFMAIPRYPLKPANAPVAAPERTHFDRPRRRARSQ